MVLSSAQKIIIGLAAQIPSSAIQQRQNYIGNPQLLVAVGGGHLTRRLFGAILRRFETLSVPAG